MLAYVQHVSSESHGMQSCQLGNKASLVISLLGRWTKSALGVLEEPVRSSGRRHCVRVAKEMD